MIATRRCRCHRRHLDMQRLLARSHHSLAKSTALLLLLLLFLFIIKLRQARKLGSCRPGRGQILQHWRQDALAGLRSFVSAHKSTLGASLPPLAYILNVNMSCSNQSDRLVATYRRRCEPICSVLSCDKRASWNTFGGNRTNPPTTSVANGDRPPPITTTHLQRLQSLDP
jgi:hypothetical protein